MKTIDITIIRHGVTPLNEENRTRGWADIPLDLEKAKPAIEKTAKGLKGKLDCLVCSDLDRAQSTAALISKITGTKVKEISKNFRPWDLGEYTGKPVDAVHPTLLKYAKEKPNEKLPGGESFNEFKHRFLNAIEQLSLDYPGERIGIVTHHRNDRVFKGWHRKGFPGDQAIDVDALNEKGIDPGTADKTVTYP